MSTPHRRALCSDEQPRTGAARILQEGAIYLQDLNAISASNWCNALQKERPFAELQPQQLGSDITTANSGIDKEPAIAVTPILGQTPEYMVPTWVSKPNSAHRR